MALKFKIIWDIFVRKFVVEDFQKLPNLVTLVEKQKYKSSNSKDFCSIFLFLLLCILNYGNFLSVLLKMIPETRCWWSEQVRDNAVKKFSPHHMDGWQCDQIFQSLAVYIAENWPGGIKLPK